MRGRAYRRWRDELVKSRVKARLTRLWSHYKLPDDADVGRHARTPHPCSSYCCGNPRKWFNEKTRQENLQVFKLTVE